MRFVIYHFTIETNNHETELIEKFKRKQKERLKNESEKILFEQMEQQEKKEHVMTWFLDNMDLINNGTNWFEKIDTLYTFYCDDTKRQLRFPASQHVFWCSLNQNNKLFCFFKDFVISNDSNHFLPIYEWTEWMRIKGFNPHCSLQNDITQYCMKNKLTNVEKTTQDGTNKECWIGICRK